MKRIMVFLSALAVGVALAAQSGPSSELQRDFLTPPEAARPWVYWYFMDGNLTREGMTADLEAMKRAGIGGGIFLEVNIGIPRGPVEFMSQPWQELLKHAVAEADRLGLQIALGSGPGWCGTGGPWVKPEQSMQHLVASETTVHGPAHFDSVLPQPQPRTPFFGQGTLTPELAKAWKEFYRDVVVLAFPTPNGSCRIADIDEKALYFRAPYSSQPGVKPFLPAPAQHPALSPDQCIPEAQILNLTSKLQPNGRLVWDVPPGNWTVLRFGRTITGQTTRPAPAPGLGLESDKFDASALDAHFDAFVERLLKTVAPARHPGRGLTTLHFDSWEMSSQNWSAGFRKEFQQRRGYDPVRFLPVMTGRVVDSPEISERFLWDLRQTAQELVVEKHLLHLKQLGRRHGLDLSVEPYDMNPCADLELGKVADVPQCEFWAQGHGFSTEYSCLEAVSLGHTLGRPIVAAEAFTAAPGEDWRLYPGAIKAQADWALCCGINRIIFHRYQHQPWLDRWPGMTMGPYGVHWERTQTWWDLAPAFHLYLSRCQEMLRRGLPVADILYLAPEGAPLVFRPPASATEGDLPDRRGYNFDACPPSLLLERATVKQGRVAFPGGMSYRVLVLPRFDTMTPKLLRKIQDLVQAGATVLGAPPRQSPSLADYPNCDQEVKRLAARIWGAGQTGTERVVGKGRVCLDTANPGLSLHRAPALEPAKWIWFPEGNPAQSAPVGTRCFEKSFVLEPGRRAVSARVAASADNSFRLLLNGQPVASGDNFHATATAEVAVLLRPGTNTLTATAENGGEAPNPAGFIGTLEIRFSDGSTRSLATDNSWRAALALEGPWSSALELGPWNMAPWNKSPEAGPPPDIYPPFEITAQLLDRLGVPPDFESTGSVRYIHRRDGDADFYFVANRDKADRSVECRFRVTGRQPEWWNPATGECRPLPVYAQQQGITTVPLAFAPLESAFIVFRKPAPAGRTKGENFPPVQPALTLTAPWEVAFDPKWGGPAKVVFSQLEDWTKRPETGIKYYSGKAIYRTTFDLNDQAILAPEKRTFLALGEVNHLAAVKLNGVDLGIAWCAPWRVAIPRGVLRAQRNQLEITVANLWPNRLIGDQLLPPEQRYTWSTRTPYRGTSPLLPSGLLGPVRLECSAGL